MLAVLSKELGLSLRLIICFGLASAAPIIVLAERLPIKIYTIADGLARDHIHRIVRDSHGFLWFCTSEGLSRFDGYRFTNYGTDQGLPGRFVHDLLETRDGVYWVATNKGVCRFIPEAYAANGAGSRPQSKFIFQPLGDTPKSNLVESLLEDRAGVVWCGTEDGLYRMERIQGQWRASAVDLYKPPGNRDRVFVRGLMEDHQGALWITTTTGIYRRRPDGLAERFGEREGFPANEFNGAMFEDRDGTLWACGGHGLYQLVPEPQPGRNAIARIWTTKDGLANNFIQSLFQASDGRLWVAAASGVSELLPAAGPDGRNFRSYTTANGLNGVGFKAIAQDRDGNLWFGGESGGAMKFVVNGFTTYGEADGLSGERIEAMLVNKTGKLFVIGGHDKGFAHQFEGRRFASAKLTLPQGITYWGWGWYQTTFQDSAGEWWMPTGEGLVRYPRLDRFEQLARARPKAVYTTSNGLPADEIFRLFEDSHGDIWIGTIGNYNSMLTRWERAGESFHRYSPSDGIPAEAPSAFAEDAAGNIWIGFYHGGVARYTAGRFTLFTEADGLPKGFIRGLYFDGARRLWIATSEGGAARLDNPQAARPQFTVYTTAQGLSSNQVTCVTEDQWGRIYLGTGRGVDRLEPETGRIKHYTTADGLASNFVNVSFRDRAGALWFGTLQGLSRLIPQPDRPALPPPVVISGLRIAGISAPLSELGAAQVAVPDLDASQNNLDIEFLSLNFESGAVLRYQYRLEGTNPEWSRPTEQRAVTFANLAPGEYRFLAQAVSVEGAVSQTPASITFKILPPIWRRWWFLTLAAALAASALFIFERYRAARMKELNGALAQSRNLTEQLTVKQDELHQVNRALALESDVTRILAESTSPSEASPRILQAICASAGWEIGEIWDADRQTGMLRCLDVWHQPTINAEEFERLSRETVFLPGVGLPGRVLESGEPHWITDLAQDANFPRISTAAKEGLHSGFGFPILIEGEVIGVLEFFSREKRMPDDDQIKMMSTIGSHIGQLIERKRAEQSLRESETRFRTLAETASDAIITIDKASTIVFVNPAAERIFGYATAEMLGQNLTMLMPEYLRHLHSAGLNRFLDTGRRHISWEAIELPGLHKNSREIPLEISFGEFTRHGQHYFTGIARDITERKQAEAALRKVREERIAELEQVRRRIATDLHDDIGSSLTQISILSEVIRRQMGDEDSPAAEPLAMIASASRELVDSMSDIVWAINPQKDHLSDLTQRMRRFAADSFTARNIKFHLCLPETEKDERLGANLRREIFLIFKESVNNMVRHSGCTEAEIEFQFDSDHLAMMLRDNGRGFDIASESDGHGLMSMRDRARDIGGEFELRSQPGQGTIITLRVPLDRQPTFD